MISLHELSVYPNPAKDYIIISSLEDINNIQIYNATGQLILEQKANGLQNRLNVSKYEIGYYFIKVYTLNKVIIRKIIIE